MLDIIRLEFRLYSLPELDPGPLALVLPSAGTLFRKLPSPEVPPDGPLVSLCSPLSLFTETLQDICLNRCVHA